ncbi:MAG: hypothetical protein Q9210_004746 [Variospora velana]
MSRQAKYTFFYINAASHFQFLGRVIVNDNPTWSELEEITYEDLTLLTIPKPLELGRNGVALYEGKITKMSDVHNNSLNIAGISKIRSDNQDDMETVLLTATTQGRVSDIEIWLTKQRLSTRGNSIVPLPDISERALYLTEELLDLRWLH